MNELAQDIQPREYEITHPAPYTIWSSQLYSSTMADCFRSFLTSSASSTPLPDPTESDAYRRSLVLALRADPYADKLTSPVKRCILFWEPSASERCRALLDDGAAHD